jgi:hypothetical protein
VVALEHDCPLERHIEMTKEPEKLGASMSTARVASF